MAQWLGFGAFTAEARVQSLVREFRSQASHLARPKLKKKKKMIDFLLCILPQFLNFLNEKNKNF